MTKIPCGGFMLGEGLVLSEDGKTLNVSGGGVEAYNLTGARTTAQQRII